MTSQSTQSVIGDYITGLFDGPHATPPPASEGPAFLGIDNVTPDGRLDLTNVRHIAESDYANWTKRVIPAEGDLVFSYEATLHRYALIPSGFRGCLGRRMGLLRFDLRKAVPAFFRYYFFGRAWREVCAARTIVGATVDRIPIKTFRDFPVSVPPLPVQRRIADILGAYDDLIENNTRRIRVLEQTAENLFLHFISTSDSSTPPVVLSDHIKVVRGRSYKATELQDTGVPFVTLKCFLRDGGFRRDGIKQLTGEIKPEHRVSHGDIVMAVTDMTQERRVVARVALVPELDGGFGAFSMDAVKLIPHHDGTSLFVYCFLRYTGVPHELKTRANGANVLHLRPSFIEQFPVSFPPVSDQVQFSVNVAPHLRLQEKLEQQNRNLRATRDLLLPRLISGELDVREAERGAP